MRSQRDHGNTEENSKNTEEVEPTQTLLLERQGEEGEPVEWEWNWGRGGKRASRRAKKSCGCGACSSLFWACAGQPTGVARSMNNGTSTLHSSRTGATCLFSGALICTIHTWFGRTRSIRLVSRPLSHLSLFHVQVHISKLIRTVTSDVYPNLLDQPPRKG